MKTLPDRFRSDGFDFEVLQREGKIALLAKSKPHFSRPSFEVVILQSHPAFTVKGKTYPPGEAMPPSSAWGSKGWTYQDLPSAQARFQSLVTG